MKLVERIARSHIIKELKVWVLFYGEANRDLKWGCDMVLCGSVSHVQLCNPMDCSMPGFPVLHHFPEFAQTYVH